MALAHANVVEDDEHIISVDAFGRPVEYAGFRTHMKHVNPGAGAKKPKKSAVSPPSG